MSKCKECHKQHGRVRRCTNPKVQAYDRERSKQPQRKELARANTIKWRLENPEAYRAQTAVGNALRDGKIEKEPCFMCGATENIHGHHHDYSKPLDVTWLCARCHHRLHALEQRMAS